MKLHGLLLLASVLVLCAPTHAAMLLDPPDFPEFLEKALSQTVTISDPADKKGKSEGSGVVYDNRGFILTCAHVVKDYREVMITLRDGTRAKSTGIYLDNATDLALVRIEASALKNIEAATFGDADAARVGTTVYVVGSPFGLDDTVTKGILSAKRRRIDMFEYENFLQTDAAVNPGNSGGPLFDENGAVVGIVAAIKSKSGSSAGLGFAISERIARPVAANLIQFGRVKRSHLGLSARTLTSAERNEKGLKQGAIITSITRFDAPSARAGLFVGDIVTAVNDKPIYDGSDFINTVAHSTPAVVMKLEIRRDADTYVIEATPNEKIDYAGSDKIASLGIRVAPMNQDAALRAGFKQNLIPASGLIVLEVEKNSLAATAGITVGMILQRVESTDLVTVADLSKNASAVQLGSNGVLVKCLDNTGRVQFRLVRQP